MHPHLPRRAATGALISGLALTLWGGIPATAPPAPTAAQPPGHACPLERGCPPGPVRSAPIPLDLPL